MRDRALIEADVQRLPFVNRHDKPILGSRLASDVLDLLAEIDRLTEEIERRDE
jgi:hypothetical protein